MGHNQSYEMFEVPEIFREHMVIQPKVWVGYWICTLDYGNAHVWYEIT